MISHICHNCGAVCNDNVLKNPEYVCPFCKTPLVKEETPFEHTSDGIAAEAKWAYEKYIKGDPIKEILYEKRIEERNKRSEELHKKWERERAIRNTPRCPRCNSTAITTGARGYSMISGFIGSSKTVNRCGNCGYKWEPKKR